MQKRRTQSQLESLTIIKYFDCLVAMVLLATPLASVSIGSAGHTMQNLNDVFTILGKNLPTVSTFFLNYIVSMTCIWLNIELWNISHLAKKTLLFLIVIWTDCTS
eukprot:UN33893